MRWLERRRKLKKIREQERLSFNSFLKNIHRHPGSISDLEDILHREGIIDPGEKIEEIYMGSKHLVLENDKETIKELREQGLFGLVEYRIYEYGGGGKTSLRYYFGGTPVRKVNPLEDNSPYGK